MIVGYVRISDRFTPEDAQVEALTEFGCTQIFTDRADTVRQPRPGFDQCISQLGSSDMLVVYRLDRLGRSVAEVVSTIEHLTMKGIILYSVREGLSTADEATWRAFKALIDTQNTLRSERSLRSLEKARRQGRIGGRRPALTPDEVLQARRAHLDGVGLKALSRQYDVAYNTMKSAVRGDGIYADSVRTPSHVADEKSFVNAEDTSGGDTAKPGGLMGEPRRSGDQS